MVNEKHCSESQRFCLRVQGFQNYIGVNRIKKIEGGKGRRSRRLQNPPLIRFTIWLCELGNPSCRSQQACKKKFAKDERDGDINRELETEKSSF